jgi:hypothetical protein
VSQALLLLTCDIIDSHIIVIVVVALGPMVQLQSLVQCSLFVQC